MLAHEEPNRNQHADHAPMEGHSTVPDGDKVDRVAEVLREIVLADDVVEDEKGASPNEDAEQRVEQKILNLVAGESQPAAAGGPIHPQIDANERHQVGDAVP